MADRRRSAAPEPKRSPVKVLTASLTSAARKIKANNRGKANKPIVEDWQRDAWDIFDLVPEVGQSATFMANVVGGVRLFVALRPDEADEEPMPAPDGLLGVAEARMVLERLATGSVHGGIGGLLTTTVVNLKVPGECYLLGEPERPGDPDAVGDARMAQPERWDVKSIDEVEIKDKGVAFIKDKPGSEKGREVNYGSDADPDDADTVLLLRVWDRHPRYSALARSSLRAALRECDELLMLSRSVRATALSRYAGAGILALPDSLTLPGDPAEDGDEVSDPESDPFMERLTKAMMDPVNDEGSVDAVVPIIVKGDKDAIAALKHISTAQKFDPEARNIRQELIARLGAVLDLPIEQMTGIAKVNHWGAWQVDAATWARYGQPTTRLIVESWTEGLLWPMLEEAGIDDVAARRLMIWFDPADAIMDPDESKTADELFDRAAISWAAYRQRKGAGEDEAPDDAELDRRAELGLLRGSGSANTGSPVPNDGEVPPAPARSRVVAEANAVVAAARSRQPQSLGRRLMQIDRSTRTRLEEGAELALRRALERAGAKVRSAAQGNPNMHAALRTVPAHEVCSRLNASLVAELGLSEDELLASGIESFGPRFDQRIRSAQAQTRDVLRREFVLDDDEVESIERRQDRDRHDAWHWLSASLLLLGRDRLYNPSPAAPAQGESSVSSLVPTGTLRQAMSIAGGGDLGADMPQGGVALGRLVLDTWAKHGLVVGGWEWVHGEPDRSFPAHEELDGVQFATWSDDVLAVQAGDDWLGVTHYRPGDHVGCQCDFVALGPGDLDESSDDEALADA